MPIIASILWGTTGIFVRTLTAAGFNNLTILFSRVLVAAIMMFVILLIYDKSLLKIKLKDLWLFLVAGIIGNMGLNMCFNVTINMLTLSFAAVLLATSPIFVMIFAAILFKEKITALKIICVITSLVGCALVSGLIGGSENAAISPIGILIGFLSAIDYAVYSICSRIAGDKGYHPLTVTFYSMLLPAILLFFFSDFGTMAHFIIASPANNLLFMVLHTVCTSVLPYILFTFALTKIDAGTASLLASPGEPAAATVFGFLIYAEQPTIFTIVGLVITAVSLALIARPAQVQTDQGGF